MFLTPERDTFSFVAHVAVAAVVAFVNDVATPYESSIWGECHAHSLSWIATSMSYLQMSVRYTKGLTRHSSSSILTIWLIQLVKPDG